MSFVVTLYFYNEKSTQRIHHALIFKIILFIVRNKKSEFYFHKYCFLKVAVKNVNILQYRMTWGRVNEYERNNR